MAERTARPLSPHLQIYRWYLTMASSILHRITGVALAVGLLFLTWWLTALARGPESFAVVQRVSGSPLGRFVLFLFTLALFYHLLNGLRHLLWDAGLGFDRQVAERASLGVFIATVALSLLTWLVILFAA
ncbi:Succinate dehydrogenase cytochrome b556 subunit [bacterium HR40]|nr:Succinate dehydrogenase cytochrome b556 subunit [bacterium HR40]